MTRRALLRIKAALLAAAVAMGLGLPMADALLFHAHPAAVLGTAGVDQEGTAPGHGPSCALELAVRSAGALPATGAPAVFDGAWAAPMAVPAPATPAGAPSLVLPAPRGPPSVA